ncbi:hypothetical protein G5C60_17305 [Streptomyces sp. HC44]|uniref:Uncharacterized protein n=1 Tax=Streptomyces scabichelini TaxID=2711217 RepID=A0A6G4V637_9ACTN|nr:hypothetical protein [Streptomyces scabichelini]NGO09310.1 hypothetical protein [Streptomyces scabichelini]
MKLSMGILCDRATVREGLLHILGAGVTKTSLTLPTAPDLDLAIMLSSETWSEFAGTHSITVIVRHEDGTETGKLQLGWEAPDLGQQTDSSGAGEPMAQVPIVVPLRSIPLTEEGAHFVDLLVDGVNLTTVSFLVTKAALPGVTQQFR